MLLIARLAIGLASFFFALAAFPGTGSAGVAHLAAAVMLISVAVLRGTRPAQFKSLLLDKRLWLVGIVLAATNALSASAVAFAELTTLAVISQAATIWVVLLAPLHRDRVSRSDLLGLAVSLSGIIVVVGFSLSGQLLGIGLALAASLLSPLWSQQMGVKSRSNSGVDPAAWVGVMMLIGGITLPLFQVNWHVSPSVFAWCAAAGLCLGLANMITFSEMKATPAARTVLLKPLSALVSACLGILFLSDTVTLSLIAGGVLVLLGTWVIRRGHLGEQL